MSTPHANRRGRSRSIVQAIASKVPEVPSHVKLSKEGHHDHDYDFTDSHTQYHRVQSLSDLVSLLSLSGEVSGVIEPSHKAPKINISHNNYPLSSHESDGLWLRYLESFEYNVLVSHDAENAIFNKKVSKYLSFQNDMILQHAQGRAMLKQIDGLLGLIRKLNGKYHTITRDTRDFQQQSNRLSEERGELVAFHEKVTRNLAHFEHLNEINVFLNKPGLNRIVKSSRFAQVLRTLDQSLWFIGAHPEYRDAEAYGMVLKASLTKALTLIKNYVNNSLNQTYNGIIRMLAQLSDASSITANALLYAKFEMAAEEINRLMLVLYEKQARYHGEYEGLLSDIYGTYFGIRGRLLSNKLRSQLQATATNRPLLQFFQDNLSFYINLVNDEYELFYKFFNEFRLHKDNNRGNGADDYGNWNSITDQSFNFNDTLATPNIESGRSSASNISALGNLNKDTDNDDNYMLNPEFNFYDYLTFGWENLFQWISGMVLDGLYDVLRNKILKEQDIKTLSQLIILLQKYYNTDDEDLDETFLDTDQDFRKFHINFAGLFNPILTDIQSRLIFKVQMYIDESIIKYKPKMEDFELSGKKSHRRDKNERGKKKKEEEKSEQKGEIEKEKESDGTDDYYEGWYPTLKTSITLLSQIHQLVNSAIFDDLAHSIIHLCIGSLKEAHEFAVKISTTKDAQLFLMKNLLLLKKHVENFEIEFTGYNDVDFDFSGIRELFNRVRAGRTAGSLIEIAKESVPKIVSNINDAKLELQLELRNIVHSFMETMVQEMTAPLVEESENEATASADTDFKKIMNEFRSSIKASFDSLLRLLPLYIGDDAVVVSYLVDGIKELLVQNYELFYTGTVAWVTGLKPEGDSSQGKEKLNDLMETDMLINYLNEVGGALVDTSEEELAIL